MNEFELRRRLGSLRTDVEPERDLWPAIAERLAQPGIAPAPLANAAAPRQRLRWAPFAVAASVAILALVGTTMLVGARRDAQVAELQRAEAADRVAAEIASLDASYRGAEVELAQGAPARLQTSAVPALENASATLQTAEAELRGTLASEPRAEFLLELLARAKSKQVEVERLKRTGLNAQTTRA